MRAMFWKWWYCLIVSFGITYAATGIYEAHHFKGMIGAGWILAIALVTASAIVAPEFANALRFASRGRGKYGAAERRQ